MSQKSEERTINGAFSCKGPHKDTLKIAEEFNDWLLKIEENYGVVVTSCRTDYNNYSPIDKTNVDKKT